ncbi:MAG: conjugal transfer protein TraG N-terminal domain-containing protein [Sulfurihydrogenibium sp.]|nr:conjugal transfer protein TraG N-terminal domain-containing protein [Sulfurihydrogenibium sp.]
MNITMLAKSGAFINLIDLLMMTGLFFAFILAAFSGRILSTPIRNFVIMMMVVYGLLKPTSDVMIVDERTGQNYNVSNVPLGVALFGYFQSSLSRDLVNFFEKSLNGGEFYASYAKYGFGFGPFSTKAIVEFMTSPAISNINPSKYERLMTNLSRFSQECFGYSVAQSDNDKALAAIKAMPVSNDAFKIFLGQDPNYQYINSGLTMNYLNSNGSSQSLNCQEAGSRIYNDVQDFINGPELDQNFVKQVQGMLSANPATLDSDLQTALQLHYNSMSQLENLKMNILFSSMAYDFVKLGASGLSNNADVSNYAVNSILGSAKMNAIQQAVENFGKGAVAVALAPKMLNFTKMMYYLLVFVLLTLALTPLARSIGKVMLVFFVFLTILEPLYVILNYLLNTMAYYQAQSSGTCNNSPAGILGCLDINSLFYTNVLNFSILGLVGLAYMLASAIVTGSGAVISAIGEKFGSGAITYQGADNNVGSLSNFLNDPLRAAAAERTSASSFILDGGAGFQSSLASIMALTAARKGVEAGQYATNWDYINRTTPNQTWTDKFGTVFNGAVVDGKSGLLDFTSTGETRLSQLIASFGSLNDARAKNLAADLQMFKDLMGRDVKATIANTGNGYVIQFKSNQAGVSGEESVVVDKDGNIVKGVITTGKGTQIMFDKGKVMINGQDLLSYKDSIQKKFEETRMKTLGYSIAERFGWKVDDKLAKIIGETASNSRTFEDFASNLMAKIGKVLDAFTKASGGGTSEKGTQYQAAGNKQDAGIGTGVAVGLRAAYQLLKSMKDKLTKGVAKAGSEAEKKEFEKELAQVNAALNILTAYTDSGYRSEKTSEHHDTTEQKHTNSKETDTINQAGNLLKVASMFLHSVQNVHEQSSTLEKQFQEAKEEAYQKTYRQSDIALSSQDFAQQYASDVKLEALERFQAALSSGDKKAIISSLVELGTDPNSRVSMTVDQFSGGQNAIKQEQEKLNTEVGKNVGDVDRKVPVPGEIENNPEAKEELEKAKKLRKPDVKVNEKPPKSLTEKPTNPEKEDAKVSKPQQPSQNPSPQSPQQNPQQSYQQPVDSNKLRDRLNTEDRPIQGQHSAKETLKHAANPSSHGPMNNPFTPIDQRGLKKGGVPEAPNKVNVGGSGNKNVTGDQRFNQGQGG